MQLGNWKLLAGHQFQNHLDFESFDPKLYDKFL